MFGTDVLQNVVHGCSSKEQAQLKIEKVFGHLEFNPDGTVRGILLVLLAFGDLCGEKLCHCDQHITCVW